MNENNNSDPRNLSDSDLLLSLSQGNPLALAEVYHRSVGAAHAVVRRLMNSSDQIEEVLTDVYTRMWRERPTNTPIEGWVRRATWDIGVSLLRATNGTPTSPSTASLLPDLPAPDTRFLDSAERAISELPSTEREVLLAAHDKGISTENQSDDRASELLASALVNLGGVGSKGDLRLGMIGTHPALADWAMGLADLDDAQRIEAEIEENDDLANLARALRRGRRLIEGLPVTGDVGNRVLVSIVTASSSPIEEAEDVEEAVEPAPVEEMFPTGKMTLIKGAKDDLADDEDEEVVFEDDPFDNYPDSDNTLLFEDDEDEDSGNLDPFDDEDEDLEGGLLSDGIDPFDDDAPQTTEISIHDLIDIDDNDSFEDETNDQIALPRTDISNQNLTVGFDDDSYSDITSDNINNSIDDATSKFVAIGPEGENTMYTDNPQQRNQNSRVPDNMQGILDTLQQNPAVMNWVVPIAVGGILGLIMGAIIY